ncbi:hypothetical protein [Brevundimonas sp.]|uniref:hypothetical protein n=1 Tax=Brevundimonas sp. TaxID=1871086 RepID=UPI002ED8D10C
MLTTAGFIVVSPLAGGAVLSAVLAVTAAWMPDELRQGAMNPIAGGLLVAVLAFSPAAAITGLVMSVLSPRILTPGGWMGYAGLWGAALTSLSLLVLFRTVFIEGPLGAGLYIMAGLTLCATLGMVAAAAATLRTRPRPPISQMAEISGA